MPFHRILVQQRKKFKKCCINTGTVYYVDIPVDEVLESLKNAKRGAVEKPSDTSEILPGEGEGSEEPDTAEGEGEEAS